MFFNEINTLKNFIIKTMMYPLHPIAVYSANLFYFL